MSTFHFFVVSIFIITFGSFGHSVQSADNNVFSGFPPVVVKTEPLSGATNVDPLIREIRVTFNKDMLIENMWSWVIHAPDLFPKISGAVTYLADQRTNVAPVILEPNRTYAIWFNSPDYRHNAFRDTENTPAVPYLLVFHTGN